MSNLYSLGLNGTATSDSTRVHRNFMFSSDLKNNRTDGRVISNCWDLFQSGLTKNCDADCLGRRKQLPDGTWGDYQWRTYKEVENICLNLGRALLAYDCVPDKHFPEEPNCPNAKLLGLFSVNREEWTMCDLAASAFDITTVPLYDTLGPEALHYILSQTEMKTVAASQECAIRLLQLADKPQTLKYILCFDEWSNEMESMAKAQNLTLLSWNEVVLKGSTLMNPSPGLSTAESIYTICYTSGTTGVPKGVITKHKSIVATAIGVFEGPMKEGEVQLQDDETHISYLPLAHVYERIVVMLMYYGGARIGFYSGDVINLLDDISALKPTVFNTVPRLLGRINDKISIGLMQKSGIAQKLFQKALQTKLANYRNTASVTHTIWDQIVFKKLKNLLGGRLRYIISGSAPLDDSVHERLACILCVPILEGYGMTETTGASFLASPSDAEIGHVGGVIPCLEFKLQTVQEINYYATDVPPRGELCLRGPAIFAGYFRNRKETEEVFDSEGWFHTGDICEIRPTGAVKIIDRKKNIFKLSQGEYVVPSKIESIYTQAPFIAQMFVTGISTKSFLVGVVVPDEEMTILWAKQNGLQNLKFYDICKDARFKTLLSNELEQRASDANLNGFERVKDFIIVTQPFTVENNLLTPSFKLKRHEAFKTFEKAVLGMYAKSDNLNSRL